MSRDDGKAHFDELYNTHLERIYTYFLRRTSEAEAQDATAEVFTVVWRRIDDVPVDDADAQPWLYGVARNVLANRSRSLRRRARLSIKLAGQADRGEPGPEAAAVLRAEHEEVIRALAKLSALERETVRLVEWEGLTREQVAAVFGVSRSAIDQRLSRSYRRLSRHLTDAGDPGDWVRLEIGLRQ